MLRMNRIIWRALTSILFYLVFISICFGVNSENRTFYKVNDLYDVSMYGANSVCSDHHGFVWISSKTGVLRLSADDSRKYMLPYITADIISVNLLCEDSLLIAYTNNGQFFEFNPLRDEFDVVFDMRDLLDNNHIFVNDVLVGQSNILYVSSNFGLYQYKDGQLSLMTEEPKNERAIEWVDENRFILGRSDGLWLYDIEKGVVNLLVSNDSVDPFNITSLYYDNLLEKVWVATNFNGLFFYDFRKDSLYPSAIRGLPGNPILDIEINTDSTILLGVDGQGLWELDRAGTKVLNVYKENVNNPASLQGNGVYDIFNDQNKRIWICTYSGGASFFEQSSPVVNQIRHHINQDNSLVNNIVNDVYEDQQGNLWFATNNGISKWNIETDQWQNFYHNEQGQAIVFLALNEGREGTVLAGSYSQGMYVLDEATGREIAHYSSREGIQGVTGDFIFDILNDSAGDTWIVGVLEDVTRFNASTKEYTRYSTLPAYVVEDFRENQKLFGCTYGLVRLNTDDGSTETLMGGYIIQDILVKNNIIWCATSGDGLIRYDEETGEYDAYTVKDGLPSNFVNSIIEADGFFWLGTENGLCRFSAEEEKVLTYSTFLSLSDVAFNQDAAIRLQNGNLLMGTNLGAVLFDPSQLHSPELTGSLFFQDFIISGRTIRDSSVYNLTTPVNKLEMVKLPYSRNTISLEVVTIGISSGESKLSWKFEGIDEKWSAPTANRLITYANLPSGEFDLKIRLYNNSFTQIIDERQLRIKVIPPFWATWWFFMICIILVSSVLYVVFRYHINLIQKLHSEDKIRFFANTAHEIRTSLTLISAPVEEIGNEKNLSNKGKYYLKLAREQMNHLLAVTTQLLDFQKFDQGKGQLHLQEVDVVQLIEQRKVMFESYAQKRGINLNFISDIRKCLTAIDVGMMEKVIDNLISNAIKYSNKEGTVSLKFISGNRNWVFEVEDQGIGMSKKDQRKLFKEFYRSENAVNSEVVGSGIGLLMVKNYVENHGGAVSFESTENVGSTFRIEVPFHEIQNSKEVRRVEEKDTSPVIEFSEVSIADLRDTSEVSSLNILVVDDNEQLRDFLEISLNEYYNISSAKDGVEALEIIKKKMPDLVVSDIMMPNMNGFEFCRVMKSTYETSHIPIIMLTSLSDKPKQIHGLGLGADAYLTKPFDVSLLISTIDSILANRKVVRDKALKLIDHDKNAPIMENELNDQFVKKALEVVNSNISNPKFGKEEFAFEMNVSASLLYKKIKSLTGQSPSDFIKSVRLNYAVELLQTRKYSVTEVSEKAGFSSVGYFSTVFKKYYRKSPTDILGAKG